MCGTYPSKVSTSGILAELLKFSCMVADDVENCEMINLFANQLYALGKFVVYVFIGIDGIFSTA